MGEWSITCSISGLGITGGTKVRCLLLTETPYPNEGMEPWLVRTPPLRAVMTDYGSIQDVHPEDRDIANLWLRGLREDLVEKGQGDNSYHDVSTTKDMTFEDLIEGLGRIEVRQDARHFWRRPLDDDDALILPTMSSLNKAIPTKASIERVLTEGLPMAAALVAEAPRWHVAATSCDHAFVVDEPVPHLVRVRFGNSYQFSDDHVTALHAARQTIERAGFVGVVAAGSGRYSTVAELVVLPQPNQKLRVRGPQWDMAPGQSCDPDKKLRIAMAIVREDVWQVVSRYPHHECVMLTCDHCGQMPWYHKEGRLCPDKMFNKDPFKEHAQGTRYAHGPMFPDGVEHVVQLDTRGETVWYDVGAFKAGTYETWRQIKKRFEIEAGNDPALHLHRAAKADDDQVNKLLEMLEERRVQEKERVARLSPEERAVIEADQEARQKRWEERERERKDHPVFGDFLISDFMIDDTRRPGAWIFRGATPGVIGVTEHLSMCLADKTEVTKHVLDAIAELSAVTRSIYGVGVQWKPGVRTGPQYPEWDQQARFLDSMRAIAHTKHQEYLQHDDDNDQLPASPATLVDVQAMLTMLKEYNEP